MLRASATARLLVIGQAPGTKVHASGIPWNDPSFGGAKSFDAALYLCELLHGAEKARGIARGLVIDWELGAVAHERR